MKGRLQFNQCTSELDQMLIRTIVLSDIPLINKKAITESTTLKEVFLYCCGCKKTRN